jgi:hypothetical protein
MKHASASALKDLTPLVERLRTYDTLKEKRPGVFYRSGKAFLHFHEDPEGYFADVRTNPTGEFVRLPVTTTAQQSSLIAMIERNL